MKRGVVLFFILSILIQSGCASMSNRTKTIVLASVCAAAGAGAGFALSPSNERPEMHAAFGGAIGGVAGAVSGLFVFDEQKRSSELERQAQVMKKELEAFRDESGLSEGSKEPKLLYETSAPFGREIPIEYQRLVTPGRWSVYKLNQWVTQGEGVVIHQDRMIKLIPPQLSPGVRSSGNEIKSVN